MVRLAYTLAIAVWMVGASASAAEPPAAAAAEKGPAWGKLTTEDGKQSWTLDKPEVVVGTGAAAEVKLTNASVSEAHCKLKYDAGTVTVEDLGSKTGTLAAGTALKKGKPFRVLQNLDLSVGPVQLRFTFGERPALLPPTQAAPKGKKGAKAPAKAK